MDKSNFVRDGYAILENIFTSEQIDALKEVFVAAKPMCGMGINKSHQRYAVDDIRDSSVWWSEMVYGIPIDTVVEKVREQITCIMDDAVLARVVFSVVVANSNQHFPHTDLPEPANVAEYDAAAPIRATQCLIPLDDMNSENGATALCPGSHTENYVHTESHETALHVDMWNSHSHIQPTIKKGSMLVVDNRLLHSIMPNNTNNDRVALMLTWFDSELHEIEKQRMRIDNYGN